MELVEFLRARLDEDERVASALHDRSICKLVIHGVTDPTWGWECDCGYPARVLAEVDAKRQVLDRYYGRSREFEAIKHMLDLNETQIRLAELGAFEEIIGLLALPYADNPDYREEWKV